MRVGDLRLLIAELDGDLELMSLSIGPAPIDVVFVEEEHMSTGTAYLGNQADVGAYDGLVVWRAP